MEHLTVNNIIHTNQFGFQKIKSTYMPIIILQDIITQAFEEGEYALGLFLDIKKAFDTVDNNLLLQKLHRYGIRHNSFNILSSYLSGRTQRVKIRNKLSSTRDITMGVPQGSILGPILFIIYINDLPNISNEITCLSYADDTAIIFKNKSTEDLQNTVNDVTAKISSWFHANFLSLNTSKTFTQQYAMRSNEYDLHVQLNGIPIYDVEYIKYLGVYIDNKLKFTKHIEYTAKIVSRNIGIIARTRHYIDKKTTLLLYNALVLPHLNYCCLIWGNNYITQIEKLIVLQKRAVRLIERISPPQSSKPIFRKYNLLKLVDIAKTQTLVVMHKFLTNDLPENIRNLFELARNDNNTRQIQHFKQPFSNRNYRLFISRYTGPKLWNDILAPYFGDIENVTPSKRVLKKILRRFFIASEHPNH